MSRTRKDLKSHKRQKTSDGGRIMPKRKMTPYNLIVRKVTGKKNRDLSWDDGNISMEDVPWIHPQEVKHIRKAARRVRADERSAARSRLKRDLLNQIKEL